MSKNALEAVMHDILDAMRNAAVLPFAVLRMGWPKRNLRACMPGAYNASGMILLLILSLFNTAN